MERTERLFDILGQIDPELIAAVDLTPPKKKHTAIRKWLPAVACLALAAILGTGIAHLASLGGGSAESEQGGRYPDAQTIEVKGESGNKTSLESAGIFAPKTTGYYYDNFAVGDCRYHVGRSDRSISPTLVGEQLGTAEAAYFTSSNNTTMPITYYRILGIDDALAVAVIFDGEEDIYLYANQSYRPETLGALLEAASLGQYLTMGDVTETRAEGEQLISTVYHADTVLTEEYLLTPLRDTAPVRVYNNSSVLFPAKKPILLTVNGSLGMFGYQYWGMEISQNGYLVFSLFDNYYLFPVGKEVTEGYLAVLAERTKSDSESEPLRRQSGGNLSGTTTTASIYHKLTVDGAAYECYTCIYGMDAALVGEELGQVKAGAAEIAPMATYYRIKGIAPEAGIAVRFPDEDSFHSYFSTDYRPETLGQWIEDMGLRSHLRTGAPTVRYREATVTQTAVFPEANTALLWQHILTNTDAPNVATEKTKKPKTDAICVDLPLQIPLFSGVFDYTLRITEDGKLYTELLGNPYLFDIGFDRADLGQYAFDLILRYPDIALEVTDEVKRPAGEQDPDSAPDNVRYSGLEWNGLTYATTHTAVEPAAVKKELGRTIAVGLDPETRMLHHTEVTLYAVAEQVSRQAVAARFGDADTYCLYVNRGYTGGALIDFMEQYDLREKGTLTDFRAPILGLRAPNDPIAGGGGRRMIDIHMPSVDPKYAWDILFGDPYAPRLNITRYTDFGRNHHTTMDFTLQCPGLGDGEIKVHLDKNGYLCFVVKDYETCEVYEIGRERAAAFLDYILSDCLEPNEISGGLILIRDGETRLSVITDQLTERFRVEK